MIITLELCSVCSRPPANRIVYRNGNMIVCNRLCAKDSIGLHAWQKFIDQECRDRMKRHPQAAIWWNEERNSNVLPIKNLIQRVVNE